ncbi:uncharacterized protein [Paramisgurnus dabryanus]|uniref:uncharacterized protein isoform X2 n=1 Tax=Paramisgurnus dabryanus TaxID=90735 RepID=UPI0031F3B77C
MNCCYLSHHPEHCPPPHPLLQNKPPRNIARTMSRKRCSIDGCLETKSMHRLPKNINVRDQWLMFIYSEIPQQFSLNLAVCSKHFTSDCFVNLAQFNAGFCKNLLIKDVAVPTLGPTSNPQPMVKDLPLLASGQSSLTKEPSTQTAVRVKANPESDRRLAKTIIDIGSAFALWQKFRDENGFKTDTELAFYLLRRTACCADLSARHKKRKLDPLPDVASEECDSESSQPRNGHHCTDEDMEIPEICCEVPPPSQRVEPAQTEIKSKNQLRSEDQLRLEDRIKQEDQTKSESQIKLEDQSVAPALNNEDILPESSTSIIKIEIKEEPVETEVQPENRLEVSMDSVTTSDKITQSFVQTVNSVSMEVKEEHTEGPLVHNKTHFTGQSRTCFQCGDSMLEHTTGSSGSLNQLQWKCSNGHLMCLFSNNNPTQTQTHLS